ncbi:hypothetical protein FRC07_006119 [Ceratobasidium sp. 392]|nr:hypothetical protein FRC07_006119 [Ceratobasidium sp. 392]
MKEVLGMHDTDSDESDSGSSSDSSQDNEDTPRSFGTVEKAVSDSEDSGSDHDDDGTEPPMTIAQALSDPLYSIRTSSDAKACIVCPGKELKHGQMVSVHAASTTHLRRMKRFATLAARVGDNDEDPRLLVAALDDSVRIFPSEKSKNPTEPQISKKDRRLAKRERRRERRAATSISKKNDETAQAATPARRPAIHDVTQAKLARKRAESVKKHKLAKGQKSSHLRKIVQVKKSAI